MINAIIVDDETKIVATLEDIIRENCPRINIVGTANNAQQAYDLIIKEKPTLLFLDIEMPLESGFDLLNRFQEINFEIIFITAYNEYAIDAFKFSAIDYLMKPVQDEHMVSAVERAIKRIEDKIGNERYHLLLTNLKSPGNPSNRIGIPTDKGTNYIEVKKIIRCEGVEGYTKFIFEDRKSLLSAHNLGVYSQTLTEYGFLVPHRSHLVNKIHVIKYLNEGTVEMSDGSQVPVSRRNRGRFLDDLNM